jgi:hypothetical protein
MGVEPLAGTSAQRRGVHCIAGATLCLEGVLLHAAMMSAPESPDAFVPLAFYMGSNGSLVLRDCTLAVDCHILERYIDMFDAGAWPGMAAVTVSLLCGCAGRAGCMGRSCHVGGPVMSVGGPVMSFALLCTLHSPLCSQTSFSLARC